MAVISVRIFLRILTEGLSTSCSSINLSSNELYIIVFLLYSHYTLLFPAVYRVLWSWGYRQYNGGPREAPHWATNPICRQPSVRSSTVPAQE